MEILFILMGIFALCLLAFFVIAFFLPEWLGITGKKAEEIMRHQRGDPPKTEAPSPDPTKDPLK
jgi:hypothetical protein